jgi:glutamate dehydrogenase
MIDCLGGALREAVAAMVATRQAQGVPSELATRSAVWRLLHTTLDVIELADRADVSPQDACATYWALFDRLELMWLWDGIGSLPRSDRWQTQARGSARDDLLSALAELTENVLDSPERSVDRWWSANARSVQRAVSQLTEIRRADGFDITNVSVALRQLRNLALTSVRNR